MTEQLELAYRRGHEHDYAQIFGKSDNFFTAEKKEILLRHFKTFYEECETLGLDASCATIARVIEHFNDSTFSVKKFASLAEEALGLMTN